MKTLNELVDHMKKFKDAVIIIGNEVNSYKYNYTPEEFNERYNRKKLKREPEKLMEFYGDKLLTDIDNNNIYKLISGIDYSLIVNQNINGPVMENVFNIHGNINTYYCTKCKTLFTSDYVEFDNKFSTECEACGGQIRPSVLLAGERYDQASFDNLKEQIINCHTLMLIGMDYSELPLLELIAQYGDIKSQVNAQGNEEDTKVLVSIQSKEQEFDPNDISFFEFLVKDDIESALKRFIEVYN